MDGPPAVGGELQARLAQAHLQRRSLRSQRHQRRVVHARRHALHGGGAVPGFKRAAHVPDLVGARRRDVRDEHGAPRLVVQARLPPSLLLAGEDPGRKVVQQIERDWASEVSESRLQGHDCGAPNVLRMQEQVCAQSRGEPGGTLPMENRSRSDTAATFFDVYA